MPKVNEVFLHLYKFRHGFFFKTSSKVKVTVWFRGQFEINLKECVFQNSDIARAASVSAILSS